VRVTAEDAPNFLTLTKTKFRYLKNIQQKIRMERHPLENIRSSSHFLVH
jgi:hypothetical protein